MEKKVKKFEKKKIFFLGKHVILNECLKRNKKRLKSIEGLYSSSNSFIFLIIGRRRNAFLAFKISVLDVFKSLFLLYICALFPKSEVRKVFFIYSEDNIIITIKNFMRKKKNLNLTKIKIFIMNSLR